MSFCINSSDEESFSNSSEPSAEEGEIEDSREIVVFDDAEDSETSSIEEQLQAFDLEKPKIDVMHFLDKWEELPTLTDFSLEESKTALGSVTSKSSAISLAEEEAEEAADAALTGISVTSISPSTKIDQVEEASDKAAESSASEAEIEHESESESEDILLPDAMDEIFAEKPPAEEGIEAFIEMESAQPLIAEDELDLDATAQPEETKCIQEMTTGIVYDMLYKAVDTSEFISPEMVLRQQLNKRHLLFEVSRIVIALDYERKINQFLNRKAVEYHRRKKIQRAITDEHPKNVANEKAKYIQVLLHLDSVLETQKELQKKAVVKKKNLEETYEDMKETAFAEVQKFETMFRKCFLSDSRPRLNTIVNNELEKMSKIRHEISETRFQLLVRQHTNALLTSKLAQIENLGNGLTMKDFSNLQTQTQNLSKKLEEKNNELNKLHIRCHSEIHTMAHYKEKQRMLRNTIILQKVRLDELLTQKHKIREKIFRMKLAKQRLRKDIRDTSFQGGLLDNVTLMLDYDRTVEILEKRRKTVEKLRAKMDKLLNKIDEVERRCPA